VLELLTPLVRRWPLIAACAILLGGATALLVFLLPPRFTATTTFVPEAPKESSLTSSLGGIASQFGLGSEITNPYSPDFIARVLQSRYIGEAILRTAFEDRYLADVFEIDEANPRKRTEKALKELGDATSIDADPKTGVVSLGVTLEDPDLAAAVANRMVEELNKFNVERRRSQSGEERAFAERRLAEARRELAAAESALAGFLQRNRTFSEFSLVGVEARRLERDVQLKQDVLLTLSRSYEEARIGEVRDTPVLTVIDRAEPPATKSWPKRILSILGALVLGTLIGVGLAYVLEARRRLRQQRPAEYRELMLALGEAKSRLGLGGRPASRDVG
jgi:uncharacterized protein involved in exopolysaccharide biosynthesis